MIYSLVDNDLYKFTMQQAVLHQFPDAEVKYTFKCRTKNAKLPNYKRVREEIQALCTLEFLKDELNFLSSLRFIKPDYVQFLKIFHFDYDFVHVDGDSQGNLEIEIHGPWLHTILFEVPILAIVSELYYKETDKVKGMNILRTKLEFAIKNKLQFSDFGTRRRRSFNWHATVIQNCILLLKRLFVGTSNVSLAMDFNIKPIGTMAHEWIQAHQALGYQLVDSQKAAFENWSKEYRGDLGIALTDTIGVDTFLNDFDMYFAKLFDGVRHDSGNPYTLGDKIITHYKELGINPKEKTIVFSDGLDFNLIRSLKDYFKNRINTAFGIGTNLTNDFFDSKALQIVMKMTECNGKPVAKISDSPGKSMCKDEQYLSYLKKVFKLEE